MGVSRLMRGRVDFKSLGLSEVHLLGSQLGVYIATLWSEESLGVESILIQSLVLPLTSSASTFSDLAQWYLDSIFLSVK